MCHGPATASPLSLPVSCNNYATNVRPARRNRVLAILGRQVTGSHNYLYYQNKVGPIKVGYVW